MASTKTQKKQQTQSSAQGKSESSLVRLTKIPVVEFTFVVTLGLYNRVKSSSNLLNNVFGQAETMVLPRLDVLRSWVNNKFERPISYVDSLGNLVLDKLESTVPAVVNFEPRTAYTNVVNGVETWRTYLTDKVNVVRNFNPNKTVTGTLKVVDNLLDEYLPGTEDEIQENVGKVTDDSLGGHVTAIAGKLRKRLVVRAQNIQRLVL